MALARETRQCKGPEVRAGEFGGQLEQKRERITRFLGRENRIDKAARARKGRVELVFVVGAHGVDRRGAFRLGRVGAVGIASTKRAPARIIPECSASVPTMNPETSCRKSSGNRSRSAFSMKYATFSALSV